MLRQEINDETFDISILNDIMSKSVHYIFLKALIAISSRPFESKLTSSDV